MAEIELLKDESLGAKLIKKGFWLYFFTILLAPTGYIIRVLVSNSLSVADVGLLYGVISFVSLISVYNDFGLTESLSYFIPKFWIKKKYDELKTVVFFSLGVQIFTGILLALFLFFGADWLAIHYFHNINVVNILKYFSVYFLFVNILQVGQSIFRSFQDMFFMKLVDFVKMGTIMVLTIIFFLGAMNDISYYSLAWIAGLLIAVSFIVGVIFIKYKDIFKGRIKLKKEILKPYSKYALMIFVGANANILMGRIDMQMIIYFLGGDSVGYYANYLSLINMTGIFIGPLLGLLFPLITELVSKKLMWKYKLLQGFFYKYFSVFAFSFGALLFVLGPQIASILFGVKFIESGNLLYYSGLFVVFNVFVGINFSILAGIGKVKERVKILLLATVINIVLNYLLINWIGLPGAIVSTVFGWILMFSLTTVVLNKFSKIIFDWKFFIKNIIFILFLIFVINYHKDIFVIKDVLRMKNLYYIIGIGFVYYILLAGFNWKSIRALRNEIQELKHNR